MNTRTKLESKRDQEIREVYTIAMQLTGLANALAWSHTPEDKIREMTDPMLRHIAILIEDALVAATAPDDAGDGIV